MRNFFVLILAAGIVFFSSCEKQDLPDAPGKRLKMVKLTGKDDNSPFFTNYTYDSKNRLIAEVDSLADVTFFKIYFEYDDQDRLIKSTYMDSDILGDVGHKNLATFTYDDKDRIVRSVSNSLIDPQAYTYYKSFEYDTKGRLISDSSSDSQQHGIKSYRKFIYDDKDNLLEIERYLPGDQLAEKIQMKYGTAVNMYYQLGRYYFFGAFDVRALSRNNIIEEVSISDNIPGVVTYYDYQFFNNGLPKSIRMRDKHSIGYLDLDLYYE